MNIKYAPRGNPRRKHRVLPPGVTYGVNTKIAGSSFVCTKAAGSTSFGMKFVGTAVDSPSGACSTVYCAKVSGITFVYAKIVDSSFVRTKVAGSTSVCTKVAGTTFGSPPRGMHPIQLHQGCRQHVSSTRRSPLAVSSARRSPAARPSSRKTPRTPSRILGSAIHLGVAAYPGLRPLTADGRGMSSPCRSPRSRSGNLGSGHSLG